MQLQPDGSVSTLNLLDAGLLPYTKINGSTFPSPDPALISQTPLPSDPLYAAKIVGFVQAVASDTFDGNAVNLGSTFNSSVTAADAPEAPQSLLPLFNFQIWGAPTSAPAYEPANHNLIYQRFQRGIMHYDKTCDCTQGLLLADYLKSLPTGTNLPPDRAAQARADNSRFLNQFAPDHTLCDLVGNPPDAPNLPASLDHHRAALGCAPAVLAADRAFSTSTNESIAEAHGVSWIALPPAGPTQSDAQPN
jgi:hypothetical protein